jgi:hypothetical protein
VKKTLLTIPGLLLLFATSAEACPMINGTFEVTMANENRDRHIVEIQTSLIRGIANYLIKSDGGEYGFVADGKVKDLRRVEGVGMVKQLTSCRGNIVERVVFLKDRRNVRTFEKLSDDLVRSEFVRFDGTGDETSGLIYNRVAR